MTRHTFVLQVYGDGLSTLENLDTRERVALSDLGVLAAQVERWLAEADSHGEADPRASEPDRPRPRRTPPARS